MPITRAPWPSTSWPHESRSFEQILVGDVAPERRGEVARLFARLHGGDVKGRKGQRKLLERRRQGISLAQDRGYAREQSAEFTAALALAERFDGFDQGKSRLEQDEQLLAEQHQREARLSAAPGRGEAGAGTHPEHGVAAALGLPDRARLVESVQGQRLDPSIRADRLELEAHRPVPL